MTSSALTTPVQIGAVKLKHHLVLAPLTRLRSGADAVPPDYAATYYSQRATDGGLLITEATVVAPEAGGVAGAPGIYSPAQIAAWKKVTDSVHAKGGKVFCQLWALGRVASPEIVDTVRGPVDETYEAGHGAPPVQVTAMTEADLDRFVGHFSQAAHNAMEAGFDGVEIHGANGYLVDQFLQSVTNKRTDDYGGPIENRMRFPLRIVNAVCEAVGADRVGVRISPFSEYQGMREADPDATFVPWVRTLLAAQPSLAYIHAIEPRHDGSIDPSNRETADSLDPLRNLVLASDKTKFVSAGGYTPELAEGQVESSGDLVAFGRYFISNPDLLDRIVDRRDLTKYDRSTFYTGGEQGYIDYPTYDDKTQAAPIIKQ